MRIVEIDENPALCREAHIPGARSASTGRSSSKTSSPQEYSGDLVAMPGYENEGAQPAGHIPGAMSIPWAQAVSEDGRFKSADELRRLVGGEGVLGGEPIIA